MITIAGAGLNRRNASDAREIIMVSRVNVCRQAVKSEAENENEHG